MKNKSLSEMEKLQLKELARMQSLYLKKERMYASQVQDQYIKQTFEALARRDEHNIYDLSLIMQENGIPTDEVIQ